jgi:ribonuclease HIII
VAQKTVVVELDPARGRLLRERLSVAGYEFRSVPHASFSARGGGVIATYYASGKLVVQGAEPDLFLERFLGRAPAAEEPEADAIDDETLIGSDECGKGDYFGPLIVAAVRLEPSESRGLRGSEVRDSKRIDDEACLRLGAALRSRYPYAVARLDPPRYNELHTQKGQLNSILGNLHAEAIAKLATPGARVLIDQFADARLMQRKLASLGVRLEQRTKAEAVPAVAAASVIAREQFLLSLRELSEQSGVDLHKGAGDPTDRSAARFVAIHGIGGLRRVAKLHFRNTQKISTPR